MPRNDTFTSVKSTLGPLTCLVGNSPKSDRLMRMVAAGYPGAKIATVDNLLSGKQKARGSIAVWGILRGGREAINYAKQHKRHYLYFDNQYLPANTPMYRVAIDSSQVQRVIRTNPYRFNQLNLEVYPWRSGGRHILICPPTEAMKHMYNVHNWLRETLSVLNQYTDRPLRIREKPGQRPIDTSNGRITPIWDFLPIRQPVTTTSEDLEDAFAVVTFNSNIAVDAVRKGIPVFVSEHSAAKLVGQTDLTQIENPVKPDRLPFLYQLANSQFTQRELMDGTLWRHI